MRATDDPLLRDALGAGRSELPDERQLEAVLAKLGPSLGGGGGVPPAQGAPIAPGTGAMATVGGAKALVAVLALALAGWGVNYAVSRSDGRARRAGADRGQVAMPSARETASRAAEIEPAIEESANASGPPVIPALHAAASATAAPSASARPLRVLPSVQDTEGEVKLLQQAQTALLSNPVAALALAEEDVRRYPEGILRQEAEVIAIDALARTGQRKAAEARAKRFRAAYPGSTHLVRIDEILAPPP